ncbi:MAG: 4-alpha-glucanotransferase [Candidatus Kapabacteria bacterium]|nr:4-alpha-glucanotransferase [Candidatus Kapabacteria bacterium]MDW8225900.1 4-alpha-glucanotransferase [Bacteroidota bacterium]
MIKLARSVGVALPVPSLPSRLGVGDLGPAAYVFAERLARSGIWYWQLLPWGPTTPALGNSPYNTLSAFAGNPLWISPELLYADGLCRRVELGRLRPYAPAIEYEELTRERLAFLKACFDHTARWRRLQVDFENFCQQEAWWLEEWALFAFLREHHREAPWYQWTPEYRRCEGQALSALRRREAKQLRFHAWVQFLFFRQLKQLYQWCHGLGVELIGDLPLFVAYDSVDVWAHQTNFLLAADGRLEYVSGAPPDAFNPRGQLWGQPLYRWEHHRAEGFQWWRRRIEHLLRYVRWLRVDHFRGYSACWAVPASASDAADGQWIPVPGEELFQNLQRRWMPLPLLPEDLGTITPDVELLRLRFGLPSMRVFVFAFPEPAASPHAPHNYGSNCVVYSSVHDIPPVRGWFQQASEHIRKSLAKYCGKVLRDRTVHREVLRLVLQSAAWLVVVPVQDFCGLGLEARLNHPGIAHGNWRWRLPLGLPRKRQWEELAEMCALYGRSRYHAGNIVRQHG